MAYDGLTELIANDFNPKKVNVLGVVLSTVEGNVFLELVGANVDLTYEKGFDFKNMDQTIVSFYASRANGYFQPDKAKPGVALLSTFIQAKIKVIEDAINTHLGKNPYLQKTLSEGNPIGF